MTQINTNNNVGGVASGNPQNPTNLNLSTSLATTDPIVIAILSALAGAIASELFKWLLLKLDTLSIQQWKHKKADRMLVAISVVQSGKLILMAKRKIVPNINSSVTWGFASARVKTGEIITERIKTRLKEKYGIEVSPLKQIGEVYIEKDDLKLLYFHCKYDKGDARNLDAQENEEVRWVDVGEAQKLVETRVDNSVVKLISRIRGS